LLATLGKNWNYQVSDNFFNPLSSSIRDHFVNWSESKQDKQLHPLYLCLSGPGTGKSRLLEEFPKLLKHSLMTDPNDNNVLLGKLDEAYVFNVSFENGTSYGSPMLNNADYEIGTRMRFLMSDLRWDQVAHHRPCTIGEAILDLATCTGKTMEDLTIIICVDGIQKLPHEEGSKVSKFYGCLATLCQYIDASPAFVIGIAAATTTGPVQAALADSTQLRVYLQPPFVNPFELDIFKNHPPSVGVKCMIEDMGGHGRALEILVDMLLRHEYPSLTQPLSGVYNQVFFSLKNKYPDLNLISNVDDVLIHALFGNSLSHEQAMDLEQKVSRHGLSRITAHPNGGYCISIPYIWIKLLLSCSQNELLQRFAFLSEMNDPNSGGSYWQDWETFNVNIFALKSFIFAELGNAIPVQTLHNGAKWGNGTMTDLINANELRVREAVHQVSTSSFNTSDPIQCGDSMVIPSNGLNIILNASGASAADSFCCRKIVNGSTILESHQYKLQQQVLSQENLITERDKAVPPQTTPSLFLLITSSDSNVSDLPPNCGLVDRSSYEAYFGLYTARAFIHNKVYANLASFRSLMSVAGIGETRAQLIHAHRPFVSLEDCHDKTGIPMNVIGSLCFENW
jgi:hypothetical protein